ncbi:MULTISPECIES: protein kinase domain-containing protein [unclassified Rhodanobacter]|uniref:serine/threonine-protein kinase n=1 Tax=unclassified Rhodanobacter TaxID=2621553 RepID=UPI003F6E506F
MTALLRLLDDFQARRLTLPGLFDALGARGAATADEHRAELEQVEAMAADGRLDPAIAKAVVARLRTLQAPVDDEATRVQVDAHAADLPRDAEATRVEPASRPAGPPAEPSAGDVTRVAPVATTPPDASVGAATGTHPTASIGSFSRTDLERMVAADAEVAAVGMLLKGRFLLEREIGRGGMGVVYLARDERKVEARDRDPYVAVKVLNDEFRRHPDSLIALQRESRRAQLLAHDNILRVYDFDKDRTIVFMTMEYIDGTDLRTLIRERAYHGLPLAEARPLIEGMAHALQRAHAAGIVHSDFKPGNVMVTREGVPKVFDFGIARAAKRLGEASGEETVFDAGTLGALTPAYASLEMTRGKEPSPSDDIYALGCVAFELLTGKHPFDKVSAEVALKEGRKPPPVSGLTRRQYKVLCDSVAFHAGQRPKSVEALVEGLRDIRLRERAGRPLAYALAGILLLLAGGWFALGQWRARQMAEVVAGFQPGDAHRYANETQAFAALAGLGEDGRRQLVLAHGDVVQSYLLERVDAYWNPARGRHDYAAASRVFALPAELHLFLPQLELRRLAVDKEKHDLDQPKQSATPANPSSPPVAAAASPPAATPAAVAVRPDADAARMRKVVAELLREGEQNYAQQKYSAAIANAKAALQIAPGDTGARQLLQRAQQAQQRAMSNITIN